MMGSGVDLGWGGGGGGRTPLSLRDSTPADLKGPPFGAF